MHKKILVFLMFVVLLVAGASIATVTSGSASVATTTGKGHTPVTICHKPGTPAEHTITVDDNAVPAHLAHGDYLGACRTQTTPTTSTGHTTTTVTTSGTPTVSTPTQSTSTSTPTTSSTTSSTPTPTTTSSSPVGVPQGSKAPTAPKAKPIRVKGQELPYTGISLWYAVAAALLLIGSGIYFRRRA